MRSCSSLSGGARWQHAAFAPQETATAALRQRTRTSSARQSVAHSRRSPAPARPPSPAPSPCVVAMSVARLLALACLGLPGVSLAAATHTAGESEVIWFPHVVLARGGASRMRRPELPPRAPTPPAADGVAKAPSDASDAADVPLEQIPLDILLKLSDVENVTYFLNNFVDTDTLIDANGEDLENRFGATDERKSVQNAKPAICKPQQVVVSLMVATDPSIYFYPSCTRIDQCGGCCGSNLLTCQPVETEIVNYKVLVTQYTGRQQMMFKGYEVIPLERHTKCKCECVKKENDCNQLQEYHKNECQCVCRNVDEKDKCLLQTGIKEWDSTTCSCKCREKRDCMTNSYFEEDTCSCTSLSVLRNRRKGIYTHDTIL